MSKSSLVLKAFALESVGVFVFLGYSVIVSFDNWPWTQRKVVLTGSYMSFVIGESNRVSFDEARKLQSNGVIRHLTLLDEEGVAFTNKYRGSPVLEADFDRVSSSRRWLIGLIGCNCWLVLDFSDQNLEKITRHDYRGPTI